jgi:hypothetical protein
MNQSSIHYTNFTNKKSKDFKKRIWIDVTFSMRSSARKNSHGNQSYKPSERKFFYRIQSYKFLYRSNRPLTSRSGSFWLNVYYAWLPPWRCQVMIGRPWLCTTSHDEASRRAWSSYVLSSKEVRQLLEAWWYGTLLTCSFSSSSIPLVRNHYPDKWCW